MPDVAPFVFNPHFPMIFLTALKTVARVATICLIASISAQAQDPTGAIEGRVTDATAGPLPGAHVTATRLDSGFTRDTTVAADGYYRLTLLPVGPYRLTMEMPQFVTLVQEPVQVNVSQTVHVNAALELSTLNETVTVRAEAQLVDTSTNALGRVVSGRELVDLPLNGRNFSQLGSPRASRRREARCDRGRPTPSTACGRSRTCTSWTACRTSTAWTAATR
jgi:hypothetical protein